MVWTISILCVSLSCEPLPIVMGWFFSEADCTAGARMLMESWKPSVGFYEVECKVRSVI